MSKKYVLREFFHLCNNGICEDFLTESEKFQIKNDGMMYLTGVIQRADAENGNGRIYPRKTLEREIENYNRLIQENRAVGELDHPDDSVVNLKNVSHMIVKTWWNGNDVYGKIKILDTPSGKVLRSLIDNGVTLGISSRSLGSVTESKGKTVVEDDLQIICWDMVAEPSVFGAFMNLSEAKNLTSQTKSDKLFNLLKDIVG